MGIQYYTNCRCPECKYQLDEVPITTQMCPVCSKPLEAQRVWETRSYPGNLVLPYWITAFGWPLLLMLGGIVLWVISRSEGPPVLARFSVSMVGSGVIWFIIKLSGSDRV